VAFCGWFSMRRDIGPGAPWWPRWLAVSGKALDSGSVNCPLVSICIPTYNRPDYLWRAVGSCLAQTYSHFEVVITDNSTNDQTADAAKKCTDPRVRYYKNDGNIGTEASCNRAVSLSGGKYIKFLMDDDLLRPRCLEFMVKVLEENPTAGIATAPMDLIDENDRRIYPRFYAFRIMRYRFRYQVGDGLIDRRRILKDFLTRDYPCTVPSGIMFRAEALPTEPLRRAENVRPEDDFAGDLALCMGLSVNWDYYYIDQVLSSMRIHASCHTMILHKEGLNARVLYYFTRQFLSNEAVKEMFRAAWPKIVRDSIFFCSCRALLNGLAGLRSRNPRLILATIKTILSEDRYLLNLLRLPIFVVAQVWVSVFPPKLPPPRE
jgi:glycosyltransferase involved in cell wall biosynthesis